MGLSNPAMKNTLGFLSAQDLARFLSGWNDQDFDTRNVELLDALHEEFSYSGLGFRATNSPMGFRPPLSFCKSMKALTEYLRAVGIPPSGKGRRALRIYRGHVTGIDVSRVCRAYLATGHRNRRALVGARAMSHFEEVVVLDSVKLVSLGEIIEQDDRTLLFERK